MGVVELKWESGDYVRSLLFDYPEIRCDMYMYRA